MDLDSFESLKETLYEAESVLQEIFHKHGHTPLQHLTNHHHYHDDEEYQYIVKSSPRSKANVASKQSPKLTKAQAARWDRPVRTHPYLKQQQAQKEQEMKKKNKKKSSSSSPNKPVDKQPGSPASLDARYNEDLLQELWSSPFAISNNDWHHDSMKLADDIIMMDNGTRIESFGGEDNSTVVHSLASAAHTTHTVQLHGTVTHPKLSPPAPSPYEFPTENSLLPQTTEDEAVTSNNPLSSSKAGHNRARRSSGYGQQPMLTIPSPTWHGKSPKKTPTAYDPMAFPFTSIQLDSEEEEAMDEAVVYDTQETCSDGDDEDVLITGNHAKEATVVSTPAQPKQREALSTPRRHESKSTPKPPTNQPRTPKRPSSAPSQRSPRAAKANQTPTNEHKAHVFSTPQSVNTTMTMTRTTDSPGAERKYMLPIEIKVLPKNRPPPISHDFLVEMLVQKLATRRSERLQQQAAKKKKNEPQLASEKLEECVVRDDLDVPSSNNATQDELLDALVFKVPSLNYTVYYDDWVNSSVMLDSLDSEQDDLHDRVSSLYVALADVKSSDVLLPHFLEALSILLSLHNDLHCPWQQHQRFWKAHCLNRSHHLHGSLVSILSRIALLNKSRSILLTLCRCLISRGTVLQDRWLCEYAAKLFNSKHGLFSSKPKNNPEQFKEVTNHPASGATPQATPAGDAVVVPSAPEEDASPLARTFLSQYKAETSKDTQFNQTANQIRAGARKTLNFAKQMATFQSPLMNKAALTVDSSAATAAVSVDVKKDSEGENSSSEVPKSAAPKIVSAPPIVRDMRLSVIQTKKPSAFAAPMIPPHLIRQQSQPMPSKQSNPPPTSSSSLSSSLNSSGNVLVSKLAAMTVEEGDEDDEDDDEDGEADKDKEDDDEEDDDEIDQEEEELIRKRREQFRTLSQRMSNPDSAPSSAPGSPLMKSPAAGGNRKSIFNKKENEQPVKLEDILGGQKKENVEKSPDGKAAADKSEPNAANETGVVNQTAFYLCTPPEVLEILVHLWTSSVPWKVEKFYFAGTDFKSPLTKWQHTFIAIAEDQQAGGTASNESTPNSMRRVTVVKRRASSAGSTLPPQRRLSFANSASARPANSNNAANVLDEDIEDELRRGILQPKMSIPM